MKLEAVTEKDFLLYLLQSYRDEKACQKNTHERITFLLLVLEKAYKHKAYFESQYPGAYETYCNPFKHNSDEHLTPLRFIEKELQAEKSIQEDNAPSSNYNSIFPQ
ncbi:MAG: hypothetical protein K0S08_294 [Gammaproteobacteria bacterium]|jgi:hypothetical protein|nr:hypothetical protein [Gammaproteobacteria bacterium]